MTVFLTLLGIFLLIDFYTYQSVVIASKQLSNFWKSVFRYSFWLITLFTIILLGWYMFGNAFRTSTIARNFAMVWVSLIYFSKLFAVLIIFADDIRRAILWIKSLFVTEENEEPKKEGITRSDFLMKTALITATVPFAVMSYGIISGAHDYRIKRRTIYFKNLPKAFDGIRFAQISDIHSGSFFDRKAVMGGVQMLINEKPDAIFFTGDLVNNETSEVNEYIDVFGKLKAPLGVYSVTGNHDYGDYKSWNTAADKVNNFKDLMEAHRLMGYDLLMNEHRMLELNGDKIAIIGVENWGKGRFPKYGKLDEAVRGTDEAPVKILLSHDPSHWDLQVRKNYTDIDLMLAGHTHGFQFGIEIGDFKWSPSQYVYKQWADLYTEGNQHLYVNRGFGFIGYPGRIGIPPEITIIELKRTA
jgi:uncharacterized protein